MDYKIIVDSCGELTDEMKKSGIYCLCGIDTISAQGHSQVINK